MAVSSSRPALAVFGVLSTYGGYSFSTAAEVYGQTTMMSPKAPTVTPLFDKVWLA